MILSESRLKYKEGLVKIVPKEIGLPKAMPYGLLVFFNHPPGSQYIVIYEKEKYFMDDREAYMPKWLATPECLDKRYKIREVEVNKDISNGFKFT